MKLKIKIVIPVALMLLSWSCTKDYIKMNTNPNAATVVPATNVLGTSILNSCYTLFGERLDIYYTGTYAGQTAAIASGDYEYRVGINNDIWKGMYTAMANSVDAMKLAKAEGNDNLYAAALTIKAYDAHKTSDMWGKIPYSEAFKLDEGILYPKYDTEQEVYTQILSELKIAADLFSTDGKPMGPGDFLFKGNIDKWKKFCNSTRLRVAIRMSSADEAAAKTVIAEILNNPSKYPVITVNEDNAYFWWPGIAPDQELWYERMGADNGIKTDTYRTSNYLIASLNANNDPRLPVYADKNKWGKYRGYTFGADQKSDTSNNSNNVSHIGDRFGNTKAGFSPFLNAAEVYFLKAEAYERGLVAGGNAKEAYEAGIKMSLKENGIDETAITSFLAVSEVAWNGGTTSNLNKIYLQKWISLFKQSVEAWAEARRTDVPYMPNVETNYAAAHNRPPFRMAYADEEKQLNTNFPTDVKETDIFWGTQMWWDKRTGVR